MSTSAFCSTFSFVFHLMKNLQHENHFVAYKLQNEFSNARHQKCKTARFQRSKMQNGKISKVENAKRDFVWGGRFYSPRGVRHDLTMCASEEAHALHRVFSAQDIWACGKKKWVHGHDRGNTFLFESSKSFKICKFSSKFKML